MKRYETTEISKRWDGKQCYKTTYYPTIQQSDDDIIIITNESDYLDTLAYKYYNDPTLYWIIALANNLVNGRMSVKSGIQIRIPANVEKIIYDFKKLNS